MSCFDYRKVKNPEFFCENRMEAHSDHVCYGSAREAGRGKSSLRLSLNGLWKFSYAPNYGSAVQGFEREDYDCGGWGEIRVPSNIQMEGHDVPHYANVAYPWDGNEEITPGQIPERFNPTASYVKAFVLPEAMRGKRVFVSFQGAESGLALWLNGRYVGYSEDSFTPSEFELTPYLKEGENKLAAQVYKWTAGSWCEDQDFFRFSGIYRDVYLYAAPETHVQDLCVRTLLDENYENAELSLAAEVWGAPGRMDCALKDGDAVVKEFSLELSGAGGVSASIPVARPALWSAESPKLYDLWISVRNPAGEETEVICQKVGFRQFEMKDRIMHLNGKRIVFHGVDRHDFSSLTGRATTEADMERDVITMKRSNINAIRTSHYPNHRMHLLPFIFYPENAYPTMNQITAAIMGCCTAALPQDKKVNYNELMLVGCICNLFAYILQDNLYLLNQEPYSPGSHRIEQIKTVMEYIEREFASPISLSDLADQAGMNPNYFCRIFKEIIQQAPIEYVMHYRIEQAALLLTSSPLSITEISLECGFNDYSYFIRVFKRLKGITPKQYQLQHTASSC